MVLSERSWEPVFPCMDDPVSVFFRSPFWRRGPFIQESTSICNKLLVLEPYDGNNGKTRKTAPCLPLLSLKPSAMGARMRLRIGFTLATVFLALFTAALWKERN